MGNWHWILLIAFYFFITLNLLLLLTVISRLLRARISINLLVITAVIASIVITVVPVVAGLTRVADYRATQLLLLLLSSFVLALVDASLEPRLPLALDKELEEL